MRLPSVFMTCYRNATQSVAAGTTTILFQTVLEDSWGMLNVSNGTATVPYDGLYEAHAVVEFPSNATGSYRQVSFRLGSSGNSFTVDRKAAINAAVQFATVSRPVRVSAGDTIKAEASHDASTALTLSAADYSLYFSVRRVAE